MILYITEFALYAVRHASELHQRRIAPIEVVEVVHQKGEDDWKAVFSYYPSELELAIREADRLERTNIH